MKKSIDSNVPDIIYEAWMNFLLKDPENENQEKAISWFGSDNWEPSRWNNDIKTLFFLPQSQEAVNPYSETNIFLLKIFNDWMRLEVKEKNSQQLFSNYNTEIISFKIYLSDIKVLYKRFL